MLTLEPRDHTPSSAQREFYPNLQADQIGLFEIVYKHHGDDEASYCYLWLPLDVQAQSETLAEEFDCVVGITREDPRQA